MQDYSYINGVRFTARDNTQLYTVRHEKFTNVSAVDIHMGNGETLARYLQRMGQHASMIGMDIGINLYDAMLDTQCLMRFAYTFIPDNTRQFVPESVNASSDTQTLPQSSILVATSNGVTVCQDGPNTQQLYNKKPGKQHGWFTEHFYTYNTLNATRHLVGTKAIAASGQACLLTVQVPHLTPETARSLPRSALSRSVCTGGSQAAAIIAQPGISLATNKPVRHPTQRIVITATLMEVGEPTSQNMMHAKKCIDHLYAQYTE